MFSDIPLDASSTTSAQGEDVPATTNLDEIQF